MNRFWKGINVLKAMLATLDGNYPERLKVCYVVRAPWIFAALYKLIRPLLAEGTRNKVNVFNLNKPINPIRQPVNTHTLLAEGTRNKIRRVIITCFQLNDQ